MKRNYFTVALWLYPQLIFSIINRGREYQYFEPGRGYGMLSGEHFILSKLMQILVTMKYRLIEAFTVTL